MMARAALYFLLVVCWMSLSHCEQCDTVSWDSQYGLNPLEPHIGKVVLVALMTGSCPYCVRQARRLEQLKTGLRRSGITGIEMIIVNGGDERSRRWIGNLRNATTSIQVIQDSSNHYMFRDVFQGSKDDVVIYDRCGQRAFFIAHPHSNLARHRNTIRALAYAYRGRHFCYCSLDPRRHDPYNTMYGDAPVSSGSNNDDAAEAASYFNLMQCPENDVVCQRLQRVFTRANLDMGIGSNHNRARMRAFVDQSDFNIQTAHRGALSNGRMGHRGIGSLRARHHTIGGRRRSHSIRRHRFQINSNV